MSKLLTNTAPNPDCCSDPDNLCRDCRRAQRSIRNSGGIRILNQRPLDRGVDDYRERCAADLLDLDDKGRTIANRESR